MAKPKNGAKKPKDKLYYGDNLDVLRRHIKDETVDLVYLDPPFNSNASYNVLFAEQSGTRAAAQIQAFEDTWRWDQFAAEAYQEGVEAGGNVAQALLAFRTFLGESDMLAYLSMMAPRLVELRRVMKPTASIYLHCDPTASHYLKMLMDAIFGPRNFRNEIVWKRTTAHSDSRKQFSRVTDTILFFAKSDAAEWNPSYQPHSESYLRSHYSRTDDAGRHYRLDNIIRSQSMGLRPNLTYEYKGFTPPYGWRVVRDKLEALDKAARIQWSKGGKPYLVRYLDEQKGEILDNLWTDIPPINSQAAERLGYPTQKPEALLERIIQASSNEGDTVLDPFCGCGTTIAVAERLNRRWIGIDITALATNLIKVRLRDAYTKEIETTYDTVGEPVSVEDAQRLADSDPYQFQWWALGLVGARPTEEKKGADRGIDGRLYFHDEGGAGSETRQILFSVKAGKPSSPHVRDLVGTVDRVKAEMGVLITMQQPTREMRKEAASAGFYTAGQMGKYPRIQLVTVGELLDGKGLDAPPTAFGTFRRAPRAQRPTGTKQSLFDPVGTPEDEEPPF